MDGSRPLMAIETWFTSEQRRYIETRKAIRKADQEERQRAQEAAERAELWAWYADIDVAESFAARDRAQEARAAQELRQEIQGQVLITEIEKEVKQP